MRGFVKRSPRGFREVPKRYLRGLREVSERSPRGSEEVSKIQEVSEGCPRGCERFWWGGASERAALPDSRCSLLPIRKTDKTSLSTGIGSILQRNTHTPSVWILVSSNVHLISGGPHTS